MLKFNLQEWLDRCDKCQHSDISQEYGLTCMLPGSCEYRPARGADIETPEGEKVCRKCGFIFPIDQMKKQKSGSQVYYRYCAGCYQDMKKIYIRKAIEQDRAKFKNGKAHCNTCGKDYPLEQMARHHNHSGISYTMCMNCKKAQNREYYARRKRAEAEREAEE